MEIELRWIVPNCTTTKPPILQFRTAGFAPYWGDWETVPLEVVSKAEADRAANSLDATVGDTIEQCARICEMGLVDIDGSQPPTFGRPLLGRPMTAEECAQAIRALARLS